MADTFEREKVLDLLVWACIWLLAAVFLSAAVPKLIDVEAFISIIDTYGILPDRWLFPVAVTIILLEFAGGLGIFLKRGRLVFLTLILCLLLVFIGVLSYGLWLGLDIDCGCFGTAEPEYKFFSNLKIALVRDLFLLLPVFYLYWHARLNKIRGRKKENDCV